MGMAASQLRFMALTARKNKNSLEEQDLSLQKTALTREAQKVAKEYNESLSSIVLQWSSNNGATYVDLSYNTMMSPNSVNNNNPYLITDEGGRVVLNNSYTKALEKARATATAQASEETTEAEEAATEAAFKLDERSAFIAELTGIKEEQFAQEAMYKSVLKEIQSGSGYVTDMIAKLPVEEQQKAQNIINSRTVGEKTGTLSSIDSINNDIRTYELKMGKCQQKVSLSKFVGEFGKGTPGSGQITTQGSGFLSHLSVENQMASNSTVTTKTWGGDSEYNSARGLDTVDKLAAEIVAIINGGGSDGEGNRPHGADVPSRGDTSCGISITSYIDDFFNNDETAIEAFWTSYETTKQNLISTVNAKKAHESEMLKITTNGSSSYVVEFHWDKFLETVLNGMDCGKYDSQTKTITTATKYYDELTGKGTDNEKNSNGENNISYQILEKEKENRIKDLEIVQKVYNYVDNLRETVFDAAEDRQIEFYDKIYTAISENGYVQDYNIANKDYFNQMLQNNKYYVTTMDDNALYQETYEGDHDTRTVTEKRKYNYHTTIASNDENIFAVNNEAMREEALAKYQYKKSIISAKEQRIDMRMKDLDLELQSINKMLESIKNVRNNNIERTFQSKG